MYLFAEDAGAGIKQIISTLSLPNTPIPLLYAGKGILKMPHCHQWGSSHLGNEHP